MIAIAFDQEAAAAKGMGVLNDLHRDGDITLYSAEVVNKDSSGKVRVVHSIDEGPVSTVIGTATGSLLGALGGPAGVVLGAAAGGLAGWILDLDDAAVDVGFVDDVADALAPGKHALVADVDEMWMAPVNLRMEALGGTVHRRTRAWVEDDQLAREAEALDQEMDELEREYAEARADAKATIQAEIDKTKAKIGAFETKVKDKYDKAVAEGKAKVAALEKRIADASAERKAKMEKRKAELEAEYAARSDKLNAAWKLTKEALA
jgi:uncharacterized membrane protein